MDSIHFQNIDSNPRWNWEQIQKALTANPYSNNSRPDDIDRRGVELMLSYDNVAKGPSAHFVWGRVQAVEQVVQDGGDVMLLWAMRQFNDMTICAFSSESVTGSCSRS